MKQRLIPYAIIAVALIGTSCDKGKVAVPVAELAMQAVMKEMIVSRDSCIQIESAILINDLRGSMFEFSDKVMRSGWDGVKLCCPCSESECDCNWSDPIPMPGNYPLVSLSKWNTRIVITGDPAPITLSTKDLGDGLLAHFTNEKFAGGNYTMEISGTFTGGKELVFSLPIRISDGKYFR